MRPRLLIDEGVALQAFLRMHASWRRVDVRLADVAREIGAPVRTFQRWAKREGFVARARDLATKRRKAES